MTQLLGKILCGCVAGNFVVLDPLRSADESEVREGVFFFLSLFDDLLAFLDQTHHSLAGFGARRFPEQVEALVKALNLAFRFKQMFFEAFTQTVEACRFRHLWKCFCQLFLRMKNVPELVEQKIIDSLRRSRWRALCPDGSFRISAGERKRRGLHELPVTAFIPGPARAGFAFVAGARGSVEELVH